MGVYGSEICSTNFLGKQWSALPWPADKFGVIKSSRINCSIQGSLWQVLAIWKQTSSKWLSGGLSPRSEDSREHCQRWFLPSQGSRSLCRFLSIPGDERKSPLHSEYMSASWTFLCERYVEHWPCSPHPIDCTQRIWDSHPVTETVSRSRPSPADAFLIYVLTCLTISCQLSEHLSLASTSSRTGFSP